MSIHQYAVVVGEGFSNRTLVKSISHVSRADRGTTALGHAPLQVVSKDLFKSSFDRYAHWAHQWASSCLLAIYATVF
jgi:hypothetical protein